MDGKERSLYFGGQQWGAGGGLVARGQLPTDNQWASTFKGEFQGCVGGGRGYVQKQPRQLRQSS